MVKKASQALLPVFFKQADACAVSQGALRPQKNSIPRSGRNLLSWPNPPDFLKESFACARGWQRSTGHSWRKCTRSTIRARETNSDPYEDQKIAPFQATYLETTEALLAENQALKLKLARKN